jgi:hydrogenase nickel incorporation protein HypA/HybF
MIVSQNSCESIGWRFSVVMHELSIAQSLLELIDERLDGSAARVRAVHVRVGAVCGVFPDALRGAFMEAATGTACDGAKLVVDETPLVVWCDSCEAERRPVEISRLVCPICGRRTPRVVGGRELELTAVEIEDHAHPANARSADADPEEKRRDRPGAARPLP